MAENASLSDLLFELRRRATPARLTAALTAGAVAAATGLVLGPRFVALTGLGLATFGVGAWARLNQVADSMMDGTFAAASTTSARRLRGAGVAALCVAAVGTLLFLYSFAIRFLSGSTGL